MNLSAFSTYILVLALGVYQAYSAFLSRHSGVEQIKEQVHTLSAQLEREKLRTELAQNQTADLQQSVAAVIPEFLNKTRNHEQLYGLRTLASVVTTEAKEALYVDRAGSLFEKGRMLFREQKFSEAMESFSEVVDQHPLSRHVVEAQFLYIECAYQVRDYSNVIRMTETMMVRYPEHVLTGFALLRLARVYADNERPEDALEVLQTISRSYTDKDLLAQTQNYVKEMEL